MCITTLFVWLFKEIFLADILALDTFCVHVLTNTLFVYSELNNTNTKREDNPN